MSEQQQLMQPQQQDRLATNKERWIHQQVVDMTKLLGIPVPEICLAYSKQQAKEMGELKRLPKRWQAWTHIKDNHYYKIVIILNRHKNLRELRYTIAHELIHVAFPGIRHGKWEHINEDKYRWVSNFEDEYVKSLLQGHMVFDGRGIINNKKKKLDPTLDKQINQLIARRKALTTRLKRTTTAIKKIDKKIKRLEKKKENE